MSTQERTIKSLLAGLTRTRSAVPNQRNIDLAAPLVLQAQPQLDPRKTACGATVRVQFPGMQATDLVAIVWFGLPGVGTPDIAPMEGSAAGHVDFNVPAEAVQANNNATVTLVSAVVRGEEQWVSEPLDLFVGSAVPLDTPHVHDASGAAVTTLNPVQVGSTQANSATVVLTDLRLITGDTMGVLWQRATAPVPDVFWGKVVAKEGRVQVPVAVLAASIDSCVQVAVFVLDSDLAVSGSLALSLPVLALPTEALKAPTIVQASGNDAEKILNLNMFSGDAMLRVEPWPQMVQGQRVWLEVQGIAQASAGTHAIVTLDDYHVAAADLSAGLSVPIPRAQLKLLGSDTVLIARLKVAFDADHGPAQAVPFEEASWRFEAVLIPVSETFEGAPVGNVGTGGLQLPTMKILNGQIMKTTAWYEIIGEFLGVIGDDGVHILLRGLALHIRFNNRGNSGHGRGVFYDEHGEVISDIALQVPLHEIRFDNARPCARLMLYQASAEGSYLPVDNFSFVWID